MGPPEVDTPYYAFVPEKIHPSTRRESLHRAEKTITLLGDSFEGKQFENRTARQPRGPGTYAPDDANSLQRAKAPSLSEPLRRDSYVDEPLIAVPHPGQKKRLRHEEVRPNLLSPFQ